MKLITQLINKNSLLGLATGALAGFINLSYADIMTSNPATDQPVTFSQLQGLWQSEGYNRFYSITDERVKRYQFSRGHCLLQQDQSLTEAEATSPELLSDNQRQRFATLPQLEEGEWHPSYYSQVSEAPGACAQGVTEPSLDPLVNFDAFWHSINEQYGFFAERNVDWQATHDAYRARAAKLTAVDSVGLFILLAELIELFEGDFHTSLAAENLGVEVSAHADSPVNRRIHQKFLQHYSFTQLREFFALQDDYDEFEEFQAAVFYGYMNAVVADYRANFNQRYLHGEIRTAANNQLQWGRLKQANAGYLAIYAMEDYVDNDEAGVQDHLQALNSALDSAMSDFADTDSLVLDLRFNEGGSELANLEIAKRFVDQQRLIWRKSAWTGQGFGPEYEHYIEPGESLYLRPIYLLISGETYSAGETFSLALDNFPQVILVGEPTAGGLSDAMEITLPNGWELNLSNEVYAAPDGEKNEAQGVAPDIYSRMFDHQYFEQGRDSALEKVLNLHRKAYGAWDENWY